MTLYPDVLSFTSVTKRPQLWRVAVVAVVAVVAAVAIVAVVAVIGKCTRRYSVAGAGQTPDTEHRQSGSRDPLPAGSC